MKRRRFLAMATAWAVTMSIDPFRLGSESGGGEPAWSSLRELGKMGPPYDGGFLVPTEYAEALARYANQLSAEETLAVMQRRAEEYLKGTGTTRPKGILHG